MAKKTVEFKVGIFVFMGLVILSVFIVSMGGFYLLRSGYYIKVIFGFASGIEVGAPMRLAGVEVGEVKGIRIFRQPQTQETRVEILTWVKEKVEIPEDSQAYINTLGLLGEKYLEIMPGTNYTKLLKEGDVIIGRDRVSVAELTEVGHSIAGRLEQTVESINEILQKVKKGEGTIGKLLVDESLYLDLEYIINDIKRHPWKLLRKGKARDQEDRDLNEGNRGFISTQ